MPGIAQKMNRLASTRTRAASCLCTGAAIEPVIRRVIHLAVRWMLDQGITTALWGARRPGQLLPVDEVSGWWLDAPAKAEIDRILRATIADPVGPEFMAPPARRLAA
jgi:hypothetical protein